MALRAHGCLQRVCPLLSPRVLQLGPGQQSWMLRCGPVQSPACAQWAESGTALLPWKVWKQARRGCATSSRAHS